MGYNDNGMKIKRSDNAVWRVIDDDIVVLLPEEAGLHALTGCGSRIWELIEGEISISEIIQGICNEYEVEPQKAKEEITEFVHKLESVKLIEIIPAANMEAGR